MAGLVVLVLGSGGREHALALALAEDPGVAAVHVAPGNPGTAAVGTNHPLDPLDGPQVVALAQRLAVDLVVVGPEAPLAAGVTGAIRAAGVACFGPSAAAAKIETSKAFAKELMAEAGVPTAAHRVCVTPAEVAAALDEFGPPYVVKDDGPAGGKGVVVTRDRSTAVQHAAACGRVVVEEFLDGPEVSLFGVTDGRTVLAMQPAQDFKRAGDGNTGPNTGGMGAYSPLPWAPPDLAERATRTVLQPTLDAMSARATPFIGLLYAGLVLTSAGVKVIEFNARFGDPETQALLARLRTPLGGLLAAAAHGTLAAHPPLEWSPEASVAVVLASRGYPQAPRTGDAIGGVDAAAAPGVRVLHAGTTTTENGDLVSAGGRVLAVVGTDAKLAAARDRAYAALGRIALPGSFYRRDIALAAAVGTVPA